MTAQCTHLIALISDTIHKTKCLTEIKNSNNIHRVTVSDTLRGLKL